MAPPGTPGLNTGKSSETGWQPSWRPQGSRPEAVGSGRTPRYGARLYGRGGSAPIREPQGALGAEKVAESWCFGWRKLGRLQGTWLCLCGGVENRSWVQMHI